MNKINVKCNAIYAIGDVHGFFNKVVEMIKKYSITDSCIIICGDCGLGFNSVNGEKQQLSKLNDLAKKHNVTIIMVRGNHDDPKFFNNNLINTDNIIAVPDYTVLNDNILLVGGAISVDRTYRADVEHEKYRRYCLFHIGASLEEMHKKEGALYWSDEAPIYDEEKLNELKENNISIKHVCTHTCPSFCEPLSKDGIASWMKYDETLGNDVDNERHVMDQIYNKLIDDGHPIKDWTYGHYHSHNSKDYDNIHFTMLNAILNDYSKVDYIEIDN